MYEAFSIISGVILLGCVAVPNMSTSDRAWAGLSGAFLVIYGIYVSTRTVGTYTFPVVIFIIPFAAIGYVFYKMLAKPGAGNPPHRGVTQARPGASSARVAGPGERTPEQIAALSARPSGTSVPGSSGGSACARVGCPRHGWVVWEPRCQACGHPTTAATSTI